MYNAIRNIVIDNADMVAFIDHEIELLDKKSSASRKPTKTQVENDGFKAEILTYLAEADAPKTIKELQSEVASIEGLTNQRITHMLTDLVKAGLLTKTYVKKTPYYAIA
jgi:DNA-binding HxlR family transcriptional regulator